MKIKHYVVTYNNNELLEKCLRSILATSTDHEREVWVINNHSNFHLADDLKPLVKVMDNQTRPDFSTGHLSRNWNQAIINGFRNLDRPDADLLILCQNDSEFAPDYLEKIIELHNRFDLVTYGAGDNCVSYTPNAVKRVGLWDERFCNIGFQEADYFLRASKYLGDKSSINDHLHRRRHNSIKTDHIVREMPTGSARRDPIHLASGVHHKQSFLMFQTKWNVSPEDWSQAHSNAVEQVPNFILYPYFEGSIETLQEQRFVVA